MLRPLDRRLPRAARRRRGGGPAPRLARPRPRPRPAQVARRAAAEVERWRREPARRRRRPRRGARDQRHALHRRHARAPHHLHGGGAARDGRRGRRPAEIECRAAAAPGEAALSHAARGPVAGARRDAGRRASALAAALDAATGGDREKRIFLRADKSVDYGELMEVMNLLRAAGYLKIALVGLEAAPPADGDPHP